MKRIDPKHQQRLADLGIYKAPVDGLHGPITAAAIRGFQRIHGLKVDGIIGPNTLAELYPAPVPGRDDLSEPDRTPGWPFERDAIKFFGYPGTNQALLRLPFKMRIAWNKLQSITRFTIHEKCHASAERCFDRIANAYGPTQRRELGIDLFGGCYNKRRKRGGSTWSMHAFAAAIDFDPVRNPLRAGRDNARLAKSDAETFWRIWEEEGWVSLGRARNFDWMHIQAARI